MPASDTTITAQWTVRGDTGYTVKHYQEGLDGTYPTVPTETESKTGVTEAQTAAQAKNYE